MKTSSRGRPTPAGPRVAPLAARWTFCVSPSSAWLRVAQDQLRRCLFVNPSRRQPLAGQARPLLSLSPSRQVGPPLSPVYRAPTVISGPLDDLRQHPLPLHDFLTGLRPLVSPSLHPVSALTPPSTSASSLGPLPSIIHPVARLLKCKSDQHPPITSN